MCEWVVYALKDPRTERIRYVGWTTRLWARIKDHINGRRGQRTHKAHWLAELSRLGLTPLVEVLECGSGPWAETERQWIRALQAAGEPLTNATVGGDGTLGWHPSPAVRANMSAAHVGKKMSRTSVAKTRAALLGRKQSPEHVARLAAVRKGRVPVAATKAAALANRGRRQRPDWVRKRVAPNVGRRRPELHRLTVDAVRAIRASRGRMSLRTLARRHGVGQTTIFEILHGTAYAFVA